MFIEDCNLIKAPDLFILPLNVPFYGLLLAFDAFIKPEMGKIETFDKNRDLTETQIVKGLYRDRGP